jgi:hypothetical protein
MQPSTLLQALPLVAATAVAMDMRGLPGIAQENVRLNDALTHAQFPLFCPECFNQILSPDSLYLVCDLQISEARDDVEPAFMFNGHYVPEWQFQRKSEVEFIGSPKGVADTTGDHPGHLITGVLYYETIFRDNEIDVKGIQFNLSSIANPSAEPAAPYSVRISYQRKPSPRIIRISQMDPEEDPFFSKEDWINPPTNAKYPQIAQSPIHKAFTYGELPATGDGCTGLSCRVQGMSGKALNKVEDLAGEVTEKVSSSYSQCLDKSLKKKPLHCKVYARRTPSAIIFVVFLLVSIIVARRFSKLFRKQRGIELLSPIRTEASEKRF